MDHVLRARLAAACASLIIVLASLTVAGSGAANEDHRSPRFIVASTSQAQACCTAAQAAWIEAAEARARETAAFLEAVAAIRADVPEGLRVIGWCEAGSYLGLERYSTNYAAMTHGHDGASGGYQTLGSTWLAWAGEIGVDVARWPRAYLAPDWVQDAVASHGYRTRGSTPWNASRSCWN